MVIKAVRGMNDILPDEIIKWQYLEKISRQVFELYGYSEIRTPILEETSLFIRGIGKTTDIVSKEMYSFSDSKGRKLTLRPEETASVLRAYLEHSLDKKCGFGKFYYAGPMFRSERPQSGRSRQFYQIGIEAVGSYSPYLDCEVIDILLKVLAKLKIEGYVLKLNSVGCKKCRPGFKKILKNNLAKDINLLCPDCRRRFNSNVFRILDCKKSGCKTAVRKAPAILNYLCEECKTHFGKVKQGLELLRIAYKLDAYLVRGLDYYTKTAFEVEHPLLGAQNAIAAGGRYDDLSLELGGTSLGACGMSMGMERVLMTLDALGEGLPLAHKARDIYLAIIGKEAFNPGYKILQQLRNQNLKAEIDYQGKSLKAQLRLAGKLNCKYVIILGEDEIKKNIATLKNMTTGKQSEVEITEVANEIRRLLD
ncbi:MAG: histidine--tRNA ligase [Candidatus Omnitrophota bacterium]|nr:histidine--tRNA ligase [Candidatus Omnitrophota bacterium]